MGWCSPSETLYDLCAYETVQGILDLPEIEHHPRRHPLDAGPGLRRHLRPPAASAVHRGRSDRRDRREGLLHRRLPDRSTRSAPTSSACASRPRCSPRRPTRSWSAGSWRARSSPTSTRSTPTSIDTIKLAAGTPSTSPTTGRRLRRSAWPAIPHRHRNALPLPDGRDHDHRGRRPVLAEGAASRTTSGCATFASDDVGDAAINGWFSDRNLSVQWVFDFQDPSSTNCQVTVPATATVLMYPAGTWVKGSHRRHQHRRRLRLHRPRAERLHRPVRRGRHPRRAALHPHLRRDDPGLRVRSRRAIDLTECLAYPTGGGLSPTPPRQARPARGARARSRAARTRPQPRRDGQPDDYVDHGPVRPDRNVRNGRSRALARDERLDQGAAP